MNTSDEPIKIILVADGDSDYSFMVKALMEDDELSGLQIKFVKPEEIGLKRRRGGGHRTLLRDAGIAAIRAAQGWAQGVMALVDNDGDSRFSFPHDEKCHDFRECEAWEAIERINWGSPFKRGAAIVYQAIESLLLSTRSSFNQQLEDSLFGDRLKAALYKKQIKTLREKHEAFEQELQKIDVNTIKARSYPRIKRVLHVLSADRQHTGA